MIISFFFAVRDEDEKKAKKSRNALPITSSEFVRDRSGGGSTAEMRFTVYHPYTLPLFSL